MGNRIRRAAPVASAAGSGKTGLNPVERCCRIDDVTSGIPENAVVAGHRKALRIARHFAAYLTDLKGCNWASARKGVRTSRRIPRKGARAFIDSTASVPGGQKRDR